MSGTNDNLRNALKLLLSLLFTLIALSAFAIGGQGPMEIAKSGLQNKKNPVIDKIGIEENLGAKLDLSTEFTDEFGNKVKLGKYFNEKPVFMMLIYYECPTLCSLHLNAVLKTLKDFEWTIGQEFEFVVISIDPDESPRVAEKKLEAYHKEYDREGSRDGWHFLTGKEENIKKIADKIGFKYAWDPRERQWAHAAASYVITPKGDISYYHFGLDIKPRVLRLSLVEAAENKIGTVLDRMVLFCLQYDPDKKTYAFYAFNLMRVGGIITILFLAIYLFKFWYKENKKND